MTTRAHIKPEIIRWARERLDFSAEDLAEKIPVKAEKVMKWELGDEKPSFKQARQISKALRIPLGYLFLTRPPEESIPIPDLRTVRDTGPTRLSADFIDVLDDALRKQDWYKEYLRKEEYEPLAFVASFTIFEPPKTVADDIRDKLKIDSGMRAEARNWEDFLRLLVQNAEESRILVMRNSVVGNNSHRPLSTTEFRGFALSDPMAPLIFVNSRDSKAAQIFTIAHELAHLWIGESAVSNVSLRREPSVEKSKIEQFCNHVAAEILIPADDFKREWNSAQNLNDAVTRFVHTYRVSSLVVLRRALDLSLISRDTFFEQYSIETDKQKPIKKSQGGDSYATNWTRNSKRLTEAVISSTFEGQTLFRVAARLLGVNVKTLHGLAERLGLK